MGFGGFEGLGVEVSEALGASGAKCLFCFVFWLGASSSLLNPKLWGP